MTDSMRQTQVCIIGAGPTGLAAAILLSRHGLRSIVLERRGGTSTVPRARSVHRRTMEILRVWGLAETAIRAEYPLRPERIWSATLAGAPLRREPIVAAESDDHVSPAHMCGCAQDVLEPILLEHARSLGLSEVLFNTEMVALQDDLDGVGVSVVDRATGVRSLIRAEYVIAADGPVSPTRALLGIGMSGPADLGRKLNISLRADLSRWVDDPPPVLHFVNDPVKGVFVANGHNNRYQFDVDVAPEDEQALWHADLEDSRVVALVRAAVGAEDLEVDVLGVTPWTVAAQVADRYQVGRVLLAGDAVHRLTPMGGMGVSMGIQDVHNLAWKLAAVVGGRADEALLDTYEQERRPIGLANVGLSLDMFRGVRGGETLTDADLGQVYSSAAVASGPDDGDVSVSGLARVRPGGRAPHAWLSLDGARVSTIDLFREDMVVLAARGGEAWIDAATSASSRSGWAISAYLLDEPEWASLYGIDDGGAVLIRPDGHIAWRSVGESEEPADELVAVLAAISRRRTSALT